jgi:hypothetical protein
MCAGEKSAHVRAWSAVSTTSSCAPTAFMLSNIPTAR